MKTNLITALAISWRILAWILSTLILGAIVSIISIFAVSGTIPISNTPLGLLVSWISGHPFISITIILLLLLLTFLAYFTSRYQIQEIQKQATETYNEKMMKLTKSLGDASASVDSILGEMAQIIQERQKAITTLEEKQTQMQRYIESLEKGPAEPLKVFQEILAEQAIKQDKEGRKLARRYFIYGSLVTLLGTGVGIAFTIPGWMGK